jgi:hypothetical protein
MTSKQIYSADSFYGRFESVVRERLGNELDDLNKLLTDIGNKCLTKLFDLRDDDKRLTAEKLLQGDSRQRCQVLAAILYDDALWRLEAAYLMISLGLLNIAYTNLRASFEELLRAFVVERLDSEATRFLKNQSVDPVRIERLIPPDYNDLIKKTRDAFDDKGVHTSFGSVQMTSIIGPRRSDRIVAEVTKVNRPLVLPDGFVEAASICIKQGGNVGLSFLQLISMPVM